MQKVSVSFIATFFSLTAVGDDLLECVNPDVLNGLLFNGPYESTLSVTDTLPEAMSGYQAPESFELIGAGIRGIVGQMVMTTVAYRTSLASEDAFAALLASLEPDGWAIEESPNRAQTFNLGGSPTRGIVCRNAERMMISVEDVEHVRYAHIDSNTDQRGQDCNEEDPRLARRGPGMFQAMREQMPALNFPATAHAAPGGIGAGIGGSGETVSTSSRIVSPDSAPSLAEHLADQLAAQGWRRDASWNGSLSSGSTWFRQGTDNHPYWGHLEITGLGDDNYVVGFTLIARPL